MNDDEIENIIKNEFENEFLDFKLEAYDWNLSKKKEDFLKDTLSLANSITENDRLIILEERNKFYTDPNEIKVKNRFKKFIKLYKKEKRG